jgi:hypothetical protein
METPEPDLIHATGCKYPSLRLLAQVKQTKASHVNFQYIYIYLFIYLFIYTLEDGLTTEKCSG